MEFKTLHNLYLLQLKDLFNAEKQLVEALPKMARAVANKELKNAIREHLEQTKVQASRIEEIFRNYSSHPGGENCNTMEGLIEEIEEMMEESEGSDFIDVTLINNCQKIEHLEIAGYSSVIIYAKALGDDRAAELLQISLDEEYEMDNKLEKIAEEIVYIYSKVNNLN
jgi:ferritin-like metal-binding protein YciE